MKHTMKSLLCAAMLVTAVAATGHRRSGLRGFLDTSRGEARYLLLAGTKSGMVSVELGNRGSPGKTGKASSKGNTPSSPAPSVSPTPSTTTTPAITASLQPTSLASNVPSNEPSFLNEPPISEGPTIAISGFVLEDTDNDDAGDAPISNAVLRIVDASGFVMDETTATDSNGYWEFAGLMSGAWFVYFDSYLGTFDVVADSSDGDELGRIRLDTSSDSTDSFFVLRRRPTIAISGFVLEDTDNDDAGDAPISNAVLRIVDASGFVMDATTATDSNGYWEFADLTPGAWFVYFDSYLGMFDVVADSSDSDEFGRIELDISSNSTDSFFVLRRHPTIAIRGSVFEDTNNDDAGDAPIANAVLRIVDASGFVMDATTATDSNGYWEFADLTPGAWFVYFDSYLGTFDVVADSSGSDELGRIELDISSDSTDSFFVLRRHPTIAISGFVLEDTDNDDAGDAPIANAVLRIVDASGFVMDATTATDSNGYWEFADLTPGAWYVNLTSNDEFEAVTDSDGDTDLNRISLDVFSDSTDNVFVWRRIG